MGSINFFFCFFVVLISINVNAKSYWTTVQPASNGEKTSDKIKSSKNSENQNESLITENFCFYYNSDKKCAVSGEEKHFKLAKEMCEINLKANQCDKFKETLLADAKKNGIKSIEEIEKSILTCNPEKECKGVSNLGNCFWGLGKGAVNTVLGIVTTPWMLTELALKSFENDRQCFENQKSVKQDMLDHFDRGILPDFSEYKIPDSIKKDMIQKWPCNEIRNYLKTKQKRYYSAIGPMIANGKIQSQVDQAPLVIALKTIKEKIGNNLNCLDSAAKADLVCSVIGGVATGGAAAFIKAKYLPAKVANAQIGYPIKFSEKFSNAAQLEKDFSRNPQMLIWNLEAQGKNAEYYAAYSLAESSLKNESIKSVSHLGNGISNAKIIELSNGVKGVWKPAVVAQQQSLKHELAASVVDKELGVNITPITVERELNGKKGSLQLFVSEADKFEYSSYPIQFSFFDALIGNNDRHYANYFTVNGRSVAIDHGLAFSEGYSLVFENQLYKQFALVGKDGKLSPTVLTTVKAIMPTKSVVENLRKVSEDQWKEKLSPHLTVAQINDFLYRRKKLLEAMQEAENKIGPEIYPDGLISPLVDKKYFYFPIDPRNK